MIIKSYLYIIWTAVHVDNNITDRVVLWLVYSLEATERTGGGAKHNGPVCPGQPAASVASRKAHRSWKTRGLRWAIAHAFYKALFPFYYYMFFFSRKLLHTFIMLIFYFFFFYSLAIYLSTHVIIIHFVIHLYIYKCVFICI